MEDMEIGSLAEKMANEDQKQVEVKLPGAELEEPFLVKSLNHSMVATLEGEIMTAVWIEVVDKWITTLEFKHPSQEFLYLLDKEIVKDLLWVSNKHYSRARVGAIVEQYMSDVDLSQLLWFVVTGQLSEAFESVEVTEKVESVEVTEKGASDGQ